MTPEDRQHFEDLIVKAVQSGKQETSGLVELILHRIEPVVATSIEKNVNGKINKLTDKLDDYIKSDNQWKSEYEPFLKGVASVSFSGKILLKLVVVIGTILGVYLTIKNTLN